MKQGRSLWLTSILMVVLLVAALSTATFAWFSASNVVNLAQITFTASSKHTDAVSGEGDLKISWTANATGAALKDSIQIKQGSNMSPMIPLEVPVSGDENGTTYGDFVASFHTSAQANSVNGPIYVRDAIAVAPYTCANPDDNDDTTFYLYNTGEYAMDITIQCSITGDNAAALRVAVFVGDKYTGLIADGALAYGSIVKNALVADQTKTEYDPDDVEPVTFSIPAFQNVSVRLVAWFDGLALGDAGSELDAHIEDFGFVASY